MSRNEFTHIPLKKQNADNNKNPNELDIEFLDYEEGEKQTRAKVARPLREQMGQAPRKSGERRPQKQGRPTTRTSAAGTSAVRTSAAGSSSSRPAGRPTAARPEPRLQHPSKTPARVARPVREQREEPDIEFFDYEDNKRLERLAAEERRQQRQAQPRQTQQRQQSQQAGRPRQTQQRQLSQQAGRPRQTQQRQLSQQAGRPKQARQRQAQEQRRPQQGITQRRQGQQKPQAKRPTSEEVKQAKRPTAVAKTKQKAKTKAPKSKFRKGLTIAWVAFCVILAAALVLLTVFLSNFEKSRPSDMIHRIVSAVEKGKLDDLHLKTEDGMSLTDGQLLADPQEIASYILQKEEGGEEEGGITFRVINGESDENKKVYLIKAGDQKVLKTVIERSDKKYAFGFTGWQETETILLSDAFPVTTLRVQIPQSDQLMVNDKTIGREYLVSEGDRISLISRLIAEGFIGEQPTMDTYEIPGIYFSKNVKATDPSGQTYDCVLMADTYTGGFDASQEFINEQYDRVIDMFEPYAFYFSGESGRSALARIMLDDSPAYNSAISADVSWMQEHSDVEITEKKAENFKKYSDEAFSCDISFLQTIYQGDEPVKTWDTNMTWIFVRDGEDYYIADFVTRTADEG